MDEIFREYFGRKAKIALDAREIFGKLGESPAGTASVELNCLVSDEANQRMDSNYLRVENPSLRFGYRPEFGSPAHINTDYIIGIFNEEETRK